VIPAVRKGKPVVPNIEQQTMTGSVTPAAAPAVPAAAAPPIGNAEVFELQRKLTAFGYFDGKIDGFYGPKTAGAIKRFEEAHGLKIKGELTREILTVILGAPITAAQPTPAPLVAPEPVAEAAPLAYAEPATPRPNLATETIAVVPPAEEPTAAPTELIEPLPEPAPLEAALDAPAQSVRPLPETPQEAMSIAVDVAGNAVDAAVDVIQAASSLDPPPSRCHPSRPRSQKPRPSRPSPIRSPIS
jgi:peptidoglycan hydrolase-like protein with peptidoglycan-binding domain